MTTTASRTKPPKRLATAPTMPSPRRFTSAQRARVWPRRDRQGLPLDVFAAGFEHATRIKAPPPPKKPDGLKGIIIAALKLCRAVGLPELWDRIDNPDPKGSTLLELDQTERGLVLRIIHRVAHSKHRLEEAAEALAEIVRLMGREVRFREVGHAPNMGGWQAVLRIAPAIGRPASVMIR